MSCLTTGKLPLKMGRVTDELYEQRIEDWAKLAKLKSDKWLLKRAISISGPNQLADLIAQLEETMDIRWTRYDNQSRWLNKTRELDKFFSAA